MRRAGWVLSVLLAVILIPIIAVTQTALASAQASPVVLTYSYDDVLNNASARSPDSLPPSPTERATDQLRATLGTELYSYKYYWTLGDLGSPTAVFNYLANHLNTVFPFSTGGCKVAQMGENCDFHPLLGNAEHLFVYKLGSTSFTIKVKNWCQFGFLGIRHLGVGRRHLQLRLLRQSHVENRHDDAASLRRPVPRLHNGFLLPEGAVI